MKQNDTLKPCCDLFTRRAADYIDLTAPQDRQLRLAVALLDRVGQEPLLGEEAASLASLIEGYLDRKRVQEHYFLGRSLGTSIAEAEIKTELHRLKTQLD